MFSDADNALLQVVLQVLITALTPVVTGAVVTLAVWCVRWLRGKMSAEQLALAEMVVTNLALAAEQYDLTGAVKRSGAEKKAWVVKMATEALEARGVRLDVGMLMDLVEAAVLKDVQKASALKKLEKPIALKKPESTAAPLDLPAKG